MPRQCLVLLFLMLGLWAADARAATPASDVKPGPGDAWLLVGVQPSNARIDIVPISVKDGFVKRIGVQLFLYKPVDGFVLIKVHAGEVYGIDQSALARGPFQILYVAKCAVPTFSANAGKVEYVTTASFQLSATNELAPRYYNDQQSARAFLTAHYPNLVDDLEQGSYQMTPFARVCPGR